MKTWKQSVLIGIVAIIAIVIFLNGCASNLIPNTAHAEDPPGLEVDPENCAFIGGRIRAINGHDFNAGEGAILNYPGRSIRVPSGEKLIALVHYYINRADGMYYGFKYVSLPPLENEGSYVLYIESNTTNLEDNHIRFFKLNKNSGELENAGGATFVEKP
jgi:hypothetical protein